MSILIAEEREAQEREMLMQELEQQQAIEESAGQPPAVNGGSGEVPLESSPANDLMNMHESARLGNIIDGRMDNEQQLREGGVPASEMLRQNRP